MKVTVNEVQKSRLLLLVCTDEGYRCWCEEVNVTVVEEYRGKLLLLVFCCLCVQVKVTVLEVRKRRLLLLMCISEGHCC